MTFTTLKPYIKLKLTQDNTYVKCLNRKNCFSILYPHLGFSTNERTRTFLYWNLTLKCLN